MVDTNPFSLPVGHPKVQHNFLVLFQKYATILPQFGGRRYFRLRLGLG